MKTHPLTAMTAALLMLGCASVSFGQSQYGYGRDQYGRPYTQYGQSSPYGRQYGQYGRDQYGRPYTQYGQYGQSTQYGRQYGREYGRGSRNLRVPAGTPLTVRIEQQISTDDMRAGDHWTGTLTEPVLWRNRVIVPAGSTVEGVLTQSIEGDHNNPAQMTLAVRSMSIDGDYRAVSATSESIVAGSKNAQKVGAIAIGATAGALLGHAISDRHGTLIGGLLGGVAGYGATRHAYRTLVLKPGTELTFTTTEDMVAFR